MKEPANKEILDKMTKLQAFALYKKDGLEAVIESYPECRAFVEENKFESYQNVRSSYSLWIFQQNNGLFRNVVFRQSSSLKPSTFV